jgi:hypothetical protein
MQVKSLFAEGPKLNKTGGCLLTWLGAMDNRVRPRACVKRLHLAVPSKVTFAEEISIVNQRSIIAANTMRTQHLGSISEKSVTPARESTRLILQRPSLAWQERSQGLQIFKLVGRPVSIEAP